MNARIEAMRPRLSRWFGGGRRRERIYIVPRWAGLVFAFMVLVVFGLGFAVPMSKGLTQMLGIALVVAGVVALIQSNDNLRGVEVTGCRAAPAPAGGSVVLEVALRNGAERERIGLEVREAMLWRVAWWMRPRMSAWLPVLDAGQAAAVAVNLPAARRGRYRVPALWVCSALPMGLCFAWKVFSGQGEYFVYPAPRGVPLDAGTLGGQKRGAVLDRGAEDVSGHRSYKAGDPLSRMDWRVFARTGKLVVRTLEESGGGEVALRWEDTDFLENTEARLEQLSFWIAQCVEENRGFTLELPGARGALGSRNVTACLEALATFQS